MFFEVVMGNFFSDTFEKNLHLKMQFGQNKQQITLTVAVDRGILTFVLKSGTWWIKSFGM